jgi:hypothetical protein
MVRIISADNPYVGGEKLVEVYGLGSLKPNTIVLGNTEEVKHLPDYSKMISKFFEARRNVIIIRESNETPRLLKKRIDIWWAGLKGNGALMILLAYQLIQSPEWSNAEIMLNIVAKDEVSGEIAGKNLKELTQMMRIPAKNRIFTSEERTFFDLLKEKSADADLVFLGLAKPAEDYATYIAEFTRKTMGLPTTLYVLAGENVAFEEVLK